MESLLMNTRRDFIGTAAAALPAAQSLLAARPGASRVLGANDRINVGIIGVGIRGSGHCRQLKKMADSDGKIQVVAASEIYTKRKERAKELLGLTDKDIHHDYKELVNRPDVDAVLIATPDHWHFRMAMDAMLAGKDVYLEKPMTYKIEEAKVLAEHVKSSGRVMQIGSQYATETQTFKAREIVQQGLLGKILFCQGTYSRNSYHGEWNYTVDPEGTAENIDWKRFLGSAPKRPFSADRYFRFRKYWDYSGGISTDLLYHRLVPFLSILGPQFPLRVSANGGIYVQKDREVPDTMMTTIEYADFSVMMLSSMASRRAQQLRASRDLWPRSRDGTARQGSGGDAGAAVQEAVQREDRRGRAARRCHRPGLLSGTPREFLRLHADAQEAQPRCRFRLQGDGRHRTRRGSLSRAEADAVRSRDRAHPEERA